MSIVGRIAKGIGAAALTGNLGAGVMAAGTNNFSLGTMWGVNDNLFNPMGMNSMMYNPMMYNNNPMMYNNPSMYNNPAIYNTPMNNPMAMGPNMGPMMQPTSPFAVGGCFGYNPMGHNMWTNPAILW